MTGVQTCALPICPVMLKCGSLIWGRDRLMPEKKPLMASTTAFFLSHIKLPNFSITGQLSLDPPSVPHLAIDWYKDGGILSGAQIFGRAGASLLGGGEAGKEAVLPLDTFYDRLQEAFKSALDYALPEYAAAPEGMPPVNVYVQVGNREFKDYIVEVAEKGISRRQYDSMRSRGR